jgi:DNA invertase Pin-like site-specific DNA recombinase
MKVAIYVRVSTDDKGQDPLNQAESAFCPMKSANP